MFDITKLKTKTRNPRKISDRDFEKLMGSVQEFPKMLTLRPIVYDPVTMEVLGGNQRLRALLSAGYKSIPDEWVKSAEDLTEDEKKRFVVQDNIEAGDWDFDILSQEWDGDDLEAWGVDVPQFDKPVDYSILDDHAADQAADDLQDGVKRSIQIEFEPEHFQEAYDLVKFWREQKLYIGGFLMEKLKEEKTRL